MAKNMTEDSVRDLARETLGLVNSEIARAGVGQLTTFNQLGFLGVADKPDGWYLPNNKNEVAVVLETKATRITLGQAQVDEVLKNVRIMQTQYKKVVGILYNGEDIRVFKGEEEVKKPAKLQSVSYYLSLYTVDSIDKERIYELTAKINNNVPSHTQCAFILPDKKLEKASKAQMKRILKNHRLRKVIKLPEDLFFGVGITTSIFVFEAGVGQDDKEFFACYMESDGLATVKNKGRHDIYGKWAAIEAHWVEVVEKQSGDDTCQWVNPAEHLSYQVPQKPFEIFEEDFRKTAMDYLMFQKGIDSKALGEKLMTTAMYSSRVSADDKTVTITMQKGGNGDGED